MATYKSSYTGPQIDQAVGNALNKDTSTLSNDVNHIPASSVVKSALNTVDESIAIRVSGDKTTYASGAAIGQYVIVDGSTITGITDGLYKAAKAIPYNTAIDNTYLTAVSGGGMNDLKAALDAQVVAEAVQDAQQKTIAADQSDSIAFSVAKNGYTPVGVLCLVGSGTGNFAIQEYSITVDNKVQIYFRNISGTSATIKNIKATILYIK